VNAEGAGVAVQWLVLPELLQQLDKQRALAGM
jgi:hypothetical protein